MVRPSVGLSVRNRLYIKMSVSGEDNERMKMMMVVREMRAVRKMTVL